MAELQFEAPLANFDGEEWNEFHDFQAARDQGDVDNCNEDVVVVPARKTRHSTAVLASSAAAAAAQDGAVDRRSRASSADLDGGCGSGGSQCGAEASSFNETFSGSLEDLVNNFDEKVTKCFRNYDEHVEEIAPVQIRTADEVGNDCQTWWTLTGQYGNLLPINWAQNYKMQQGTKRSVSRLHSNLGYSDLDLYDDDQDMDREEDELYFTNDDLHDPESPVSLQEPVISAEEVISEIEAMMEEVKCGTMLNVIEWNKDTAPERTSSSERSESEDTTTSSSQGSSPDDMHRSTMWFEDSLKRLSINALCQLYDELDSAVKEYTQLLFQEISLNEELKYEKGLNNDFICLMISLQNKQREAKLDIDNAVKRQTREGMYLTTVIPYQASEGPPTIEQLQIYIKILLAIDQDSPAVPALLTDYILKVLCPTT